MPAYRLLHSLQCLALLAHLQAAPAFITDSRTCRSSPPTQHMRHARRLCALLARTLTWRMSWRTS